MQYMKRLLVCVAVLASCFTETCAAPPQGTKARGSDLEPNSAFLEDGGPGSSSASVSFSTFRAEASFDAQSTFLPILRAESEGQDATFDDDRTQAEAEAYQVFTSSMAQTIRLDITLDSVVTNGPDGTSGVLSNVYVIGGSGFEVSDTFCSPGQFTFDGVYLCGSRIAQSELKPTLNWSNLFNGGDNPSLTDALTFDVSAGESFGIYAELSAGSFQGTADAFNTLSLSFEDDTGITVVPEPASCCLLGIVLLGLSAASRIQRRTIVPTMMLGVVGRSS